MMTDGSGQSDLANLSQTLNAIELPANQQSQELHSSANALIDTYKRLLLTSLDLIEKFSVQGVVPTDFYAEVEEQIRRLEAVEQQAIDKFEVARRAFMQSEM